ncbi:hypothetical protein DCC62_32115 [candidate division KSB1 bacterium]|nr:MAG: hypothetical protein DCC62_32115 [candidate division KSB1 bacterium]
MSKRPLAELTAVERVALQASPFQPLYSPREKINTIVVANFPALGKLAAMRFIEWVQHNPGGVISLPTGKTPEHFIDFIAHRQNAGTLHQMGDLSAGELDAARGAK